MATAVPALLAAFPDDSAGVSEAVAIAVSRLDPTAVGRLADALVDSADIESKLALIRTVVRSRGDALSVLHRLRTDPSPAVRAAAIESMGRLVRRGGGDGLSTAGDAGGP